MIPRSYIEEWRSKAPWQDDYQVEQDLIIEKAIVELFSDELISNNFAFRGGTALHKLFLSPQSRYSEDIDLVQMVSSPIKPIFQRLEKILSFIEGKRSIEQSRSNNMIKYQYESEIAPVKKMKLKIEINCREKLCVYGINVKSFVTDSGWYSSGSKIKTYEIEELLGTKLRALYQRRKGRDLFDLYWALTHADLKIDRIVDSFRKYMNYNETQIPSSKNFISNLEKKIEDKEFTGDIHGLLRPSIVYDSEKAFDLVRDKIIVKI
jgi:predicted nucleotidyltransferase component of viral defense system